LVTGGVDTHLDVHVAAALNQIGGLLGTASFPTTPVGYAQLTEWLRSFGAVVQVGVEGTSSYGAGLTRALEAEGIAVVEVDRPKRQDRRRVGKSDTIDAIAAARSALSGEALGLPKTKNGNVEGIRVLGVARASSIKARTQTLNQIRSLVSTAPADLRERLRALPIKQLVEVCAAFRPGTDSTVETVTKLSLRILARRVLFLDAEVADLDKRRTGLVSQVAPQLLAALGVGPHTAATLLVAVGDNPERLSNRSVVSRGLTASPPSLTAAGRPTASTGCTEAEERQAAARSGPSPGSHGKPPTRACERRNSRHADPFICAASRTSPARSSNSSHAKNCVDDLRSFVSLSS
jgi:transposase